MLTEIHGPLQSCQHCRSGFPDCRNITGGICTFFVGDEVTALTSYKFTETGITTVNIVPLGDMDCELTVVAVGGGGIYSGWYGGGGSGYVASTSVMPSPLSQLVVRVGGPGELSSLETREGETRGISIPLGERCAIGEFLGQLSSSYVVNLMIF